MDFEEKLMQGLGRVEVSGLGQIKPWSDQTVDRLAESGISVGLGFGIGLVLDLLFPQLRLARPLLFTAMAAGTSLASSVTPVEGKLLDKISGFAGGLTGLGLASAVMGR